MRSLSVWCVVSATAFSLAACGGGSSQTVPVTSPTPATSVAPAASPTIAATTPAATPGNPYSTPTITPTAAATVTPTITPAASPTAAAATTLATATLLGSPGFINSAQLTVYELSGDTPTGLECTVSSGCTGAWPPVAPPSGVALSTGFTVFTRSDNALQQLAYNGHPLYTFSGDRAAGDTNGNGLNSFGGTWSVARP